MYSKKLKINPDHIDCQGILDKIHYSYYYEKVRHEMLSTLGKTIEQLATEGIYPILLDEHIKFKRMITGGEIEVTCQFKKLSKVKIVALQEIRFEGKLASTNRCEITCFPAKGGRPFFPEYLKEHINELEKE